MALLWIKMKFSILNCFAVTELDEVELQFERSFKYLSIPSAYFKINMPLAALLNLKLLQTNAAGHRQTVNVEP
jgi:hypothetical protein